MTLKEALAKHQALLWYISIVIAYTILALVVLIYVSTLAKIPPYSHVLNIGSTLVNSLYSSVVVAICITPGAILVRKTYVEISLLHPFAVASRGPVSIVDFDSMSDPGVQAVRITLKYSFWRALVQLVLMVVGWLLIPVGLLIVTTDQYIPQTPGIAMFPMPRLNGSGSELSVAMNPFAGSGSFQPALNGSDQFLGIVTASYQGSLVEDRNLF